MKLTYAQLGATNPLVDHYLQGDKNVAAFFEYSWNCDEETRVRADYLLTRDEQYDREGIACHIEAYMSRFGVVASAVRENVEKLRDNALVVVGGQQAGLMLGPMYTIYKMISLVRLARIESEKLAVPVVPVFWIAGEDHDYDEVNHVWLKYGVDVFRHEFPKVNAPRSKSMVSDVVLDVDVLRTWIDEIIGALGETAHTNEILTWLRKMASHSMSMSDFFARLTISLFGDTGLLLVDSGDQALRRLAHPFYCTLKEKSNEISHAVFSRQQRLKALGFSPMLSISADSANLFYYDVEKKERSLLMRGDERFLRIFDTASLSTNVVTRPLLQEKLFPVLKFVAGPGEIAYWAELGSAFRAVGEIMPPVVPRLHFTLIERGASVRANVLGLDVSQVIRNGCAEEREKAICARLNKDVSVCFEELNEAFTTLHHAWCQAGLGVDQNLLSMFEKNKQLIDQQLVLMQEKIDEADRRLHSALIQKFDEVESCLHPLGGLQERGLNMVYFLNKYGFDWLTYLTDAKYKYSSEHGLLLL